MHSLAAQAKHDWRHSCGGACAVQSWVHGQGLQKLSACGRFTAWPRYAECRASGVQHRGFAVESWAHMATGLMQWWGVAVHVLPGLASC